MEQRRNLFETIEQPLREHYSFQIQPAQLKSVEREYTSRMRNRWFLTILLMGLAICISLKTSRILLGVCIGCSVYAVLIVCINFYRIKKTVKDAMERYQATEFAYYLYDDCMAIQISGVKEYRELIVPLDQIKNHRIVSDLVVMEYRGLIYIIDRQILPDDSYFIRNAKHDS